MNEMLKEQQAITASRQATNKRMARRQISFFSLVKREVTRFLKVYFQTVVGPVVTAILFIIVFATSLRGQVVSMDGVPFVTFLGAGLVMMTLMQNAFANTSSSIFSMKAYGTFSDILMAPIDDISIVVAFLVGGIVRGFVTGGVCLLVFIPFTAFSWHNPLLMLIFALLGSSLLALLGIMAGIWGQKWDHNAAFSNFVITPLSFLSGTFYSIERLPPLFYQTCLYNPFFYVIDGFRYGLTGASDVDYADGIAFLLACNLLLFWVVVKLVKAGWRIKS